MNKLVIIGNLTKDVELRTTTSGISMATFTVAVNQRVRAGEKPKTDFFDVVAWRGTADNCSKYLNKGKKVCVTGSVSLNTWKGKDGAEHSKLEVTAEDVEFLSPKTEAPISDRAEDNGFTPVDMAQADLPF